jgi:hypothetical protein
MALRECTTIHPHKEHIWTGMDLMDDKPVWKDMLCQGRGTALAGIHEYISDPQSGAGNCACGAALRHVRHMHGFMQAAHVTQRNCVCGQGEMSPLHISVHTRHE